MRHWNIAGATANSAIRAACMAEGLSEGEGFDFGPDRLMPDLYSYARARNFPAPETLARKHMTLAGVAFPWAGLDDAPEFVRAFYTTFRAVAQALEPFHEEGSEHDDRPQFDPGDAAADPGNPDADPGTETGAAADPDGDLAAGAADATKDGDAEDAAGAEGAVLGGVADDAAGADADDGAAGGDGDGDGGDAGGNEEAKDNPPAAKKKNK